MSHNNYGIEKDFIKYLKKSFSSVLINIYFLLKIVIKIIRLVCNGHCEH